MARRRDLQKEGEAMRVACQKKGGGSSASKLLKEGNQAYEESFSSLSIQVHHCGELLGKRKEGGEVVELAFSLRDAVALDVHSRAHHGAKLGVSILRS